MTIVYDNWERLVRATLKRDELWRIGHEHSRTPSNGSTSSDASPDLISKVTPKSSSERISSLNKNNRGGRAAEFKKPKSLKKEKSSGMRLDRWVWTRWFSNTFSAQITDA